MPDFTSVELGPHSSKRGDERQALDRVLDPSTDKILATLRKQGVYSGVEGCISTGKEANVYSAVIEESETKRYLAIKVFAKVNVFKGRKLYTEGSHRHETAYQSSRSLIAAWAASEFSNLKRLRGAGIPVPEPILLKENVLCMSFLGDNEGNAYPRLHKAAFEGNEARERWTNLYVQLTSYMRKMYQVCQIIHGDLSEYNILYGSGQLHIIDVSQAVDRNHKEALALLRMDIKNVNSFFERKGVSVLPQATAFDFIINSEGPVLEPELSQTIQALLETTVQPKTEQERNKAEVEEAVFQTTFIPQTLDELYEMEEEGHLVNKSKIQHLLASNNESEDDEDGGIDFSNDGESEESEREWEEREKKQPRGRKHEDKQEKHAHKMAVKEANKERRKTKMPKEVKKKLINKTANHGRGKVK